MPDRWTPLYTEAEENAIARLVKESGLSRDFVVWYLAQTSTALDYAATAGGFAEAGKSLQGIRRIEAIDKGYNEWLATRAGRGAEGGKAAEARAADLTLTDPVTQPFAYLGERFSQQVQMEAQMMGMDVQQYLQYLRDGGERPEGRPILKDGVWTVSGEEVPPPGPDANTTTAATGAVAGEIGSIFSELTQEDLDQMGVTEISEKFGLQRLAIEEPEAFLRAMFDKSGVVPSPPIYGFIRDLMPSLVTLASTREGQDIMVGGGALELNQVLNQVLEQGYPTRESVLGGLAGMGEMARPFLTAEIEDPRTRFRFVMSTLDRLVGPTMSEPLRRTLFSQQMAEDQGDKFLSASARGVFQGDFIDYLREQGYPIPDLPAYQPEAGAVAGAEPQVATEGGLATGVAPGGAPAFVVREGIYE